MKFTKCYTKKTKSFSMDFTAIVAPAYNSNPEHDNNIPHRRHIIQ